VAQRLGLKVGRAIYPQVGGHTPQSMLNEFAARIAEGEIDAALICGAEAIRTTAEAQRAGLALDWHEDPPGDCEDRGLGAALTSELELHHGIGMPVFTYPLFEHAIRARRGATVEQHLRSMAILFERFNRIASRNHHAQFGAPRSAAELATLDTGNRWIGHPYPKRLNAQDRVDQAAALILTSAATARDLGVDPQRWVFLHGCADVSEKGFVLERADLARSPATALAAQRALAMAERRIEDLSVFDLYSCFPSAVETACQALGVAESDPRDLTVTGGLPFFGGPGNNYSLHAIAEMCVRLRHNREEFGLVMANGGYLSKQSCGIYSGRPLAGAWKREAPGAYQAHIDELRCAEVTEQPCGRARVETYTVAHERGVPVRAIVIGRLLDGDRSGARFVANTPAARDDILQWMVTADPLDAVGNVRFEHGRNVFTPDGFSKS
jgi:acetyl-CoA C-acetyltransferase